VVREGVGAGGEMNQALYAHMNNERKMKKKKNSVHMDFRKTVGSQGFFSTKRALFQAHLHGSPLA
jgi:hypothetical protein